MMTHWLLFVTPVLSFVSIILVMTSPILLILTYAGEAFIGTGGLKVFLSIYRSMKS